MTKKQDNRGKVLTPLKREQMFKVYVASKHLPSVIRQCSVSKPTAIKYKRIDKWEERLEKIQLKAAKIADNTESKRLAENLQLVKKAKLVWVTALLGKTKCPHCSGSVVVPSLDPKFIDLDKLVRLEEFLSGSPDSRQEISGDQIDDIEELKQLLRQKKEKLKNLSSKSK